MMHVDLLKALLPSSIDPQAPNLAGELVAEGNALDAALYSADQILLEADPRTTSLMLSDWERVYGLPESCILAAGITQSIAERRAALVAKVSMQGGQGDQFFIDLAAALGYQITITLLHAETTEDNTEYAVMDEQYKFVWQVNAPLNTVRNFTTEDDTEMALAVWSNVLLECTIKRYQPADFFVLFSYS